MEFHLYLILYTNINSTWIKDVNIKPEPIQLLNHDTGIVDDLLNINTKAEGTKVKINKHNYIKLKICTDKETSNRGKRNEDIISKHTSYKGLTHEMFEKCKQS
jgi:hypothetical protein